MVSLQLSPSMTIWPAVSDMVWNFLTCRFGKWRRHRELFSLLGKQVENAYSPLTSWCKGATLWLMVVIYAWRQPNLATISFFGAQWLIVQGIWCITYWVSIRWLRVWWKNELWTWGGIGKKSKIIKLIPLTILWVMCKKRNNKAFDGCVRDISRIRDSEYILLRL